MADVPDRQPHDPSSLRISDAERHDLAEFLRVAAGDGRLDFDELDERLEAAYSAKTYADLVPLVVDLPGGADVVPAAGVPAVPAAPIAAAEHRNSLAIMSGQDRKGAWVVGPTHTAFTLMGGVLLDLRQATFAAPEVEITANAVMGGIDIVVNAWTRVSVEGTGIMGAFEEGRPKVAPEIGPRSPLVRVKGVALMGAVTVVRKPMPGEKRRLLGRH